MERAAQAATHGADGAIQCATHCAAHSTDSAANSAYCVVERAAQAATHGTNHAVQGTAHCADCMADGLYAAVDQPTHAQRAVLRGNGGLPGQLEIAISHHFLAVRRLHAHLAGNAGVEGGTDRAIMRFTRQFFLGRQLSGHHRLGLALSADRVPGQRQARIGVAADRRLHAG